ncbi:hypothetical protein [Bauldia sp.]|uniref:hypothetical protein n=1 Tax=Bauldia sp. TaxID=2575872 RepID=UPI003BABA9E1
MDYWFVAAGVVSGLIAAIHLVPGGRTVARPLLNAQDIAPVAKYVNYYCWHNVSFVLILMAGLFVAAGYGYFATAFGLVGILLAAFLCIWGLALPVLKRQRFTDMPQGWLFAPVLVLGLVGIAVS